MGEGTKPSIEREGGWERAQNLEAELIQQARRANIRTASSKFQIFHKLFQKFTLLNQTTQGKKSPM